MHGIIHEQRVAKCEHERIESVGQRRERERERESTAEIRPPNRGSKVKHTENEVKSPKSKPPNGTLTNLQGHITLFQTLEFGPCSMIFVCISYLRTFVMVYVKLKMSHVHFQKSGI